MTVSVRTTPLVNLRGRALVVNDKRIQQILLNFKNHI